MRILSTLVILLTISLAGMSAGMKHKGTFAEKDLFQSAYFIKNVPGLYTPYHGQAVRYFAAHDGVVVFLTDAGPVYQLIKKDGDKIRERQREEERDKKKHKESEEENELIPVKASYADVRWIGANPHPLVDADDRAPGTYSYLAGRPGVDYHSIQTGGYGRVTYHDLYPGIDVVYTFPDRGGMEYALTVHPGADLGRVKMRYGGSVRSITPQPDGDMLIHTATGDVLEHAPVSYMEQGGAVASAYDIQGTTVGFSLPGGYDTTRTMIVDPWVDVLTQLTVKNLGTSVDYDIAGNLYVYGAGASYVEDDVNYQKVAKFDISGNFQWVFMGSVPSISWTTVTGGGIYNELANAKVDKVNSKVYVTQGYLSTGNRIIRLTAAGVYDNFVSTPNPNFQEAWSVINNCVTGDILALGGGTSSDLNMGIINTTTGVVAPSNITGATGSFFQDIVSGTYDAFGNLYVVMASGATPSVNNKIFRSNTAYTGFVWKVATGFAAFAELNNLPAFDNADGANSNNYNSLAANSSYLYYYDGHNLVAHDLNTGAVVGSTTTTYATLAYGGIAVDNCNNVYVGGLGVIKTYLFNGTAFVAGTDISLGAGFGSDAVNDVRYNSSNNLLYVAGASVTGTVIATPSITCTVVTTMTAVVTPTCDQASIVVTPGSGLINPVFSYLWENSSGTVLRQTTPGTILVDTLTGITAGTYTVQVQLNVNCGGATFLDTFMTVCSSLTVSPDTSICSGGTATLTATGMPAGGSYLWTPGNLTTATIMVSPTVTTAYFVTYTPPAGSPITDSDLVTILTAATVTVNDTTICQGYGATLTATPSVTGGTYLWTPGNATTQAITVSPAATATYKVRYTSPGCGTPLDSGTITVRNPSTKAIAQSICAGTSATFNGRTLTTNGIYKDTLVNAGGCDSIVTLTLTIIPTSATAISQSICSNTTATFNGHTLSTAGIYKDTLTNIAGCDSFVTLTLTVIPTTATSLTQSICSNTTTTFNGHTISAAGIYKDTLTNIAGCDSFVTLTLTVIPTSSTALAQSICSNTTTTFNGHTISAAGIYKDTMTNIAGCDSFVTLTLTVIPISTKAIAQSICAGTSTTFNGRTLTTGGIYKDTLVNAGGCDSIVTLTLTVIPTSATAISQSICSNTTATFNGHTLSTAGIYKDTLTNAAGCDSFVTLTLTVVQTSASSLSQTICGNEVYSFAGQALSASGVYTNALTNAAGCDSTVTLTLTVVPVSATALSQTICSNTVTTFDGQTLSAAGIYIDTFTNAGGCDSIVTFTLTVVPTSATAISQSICAGTSYVFNGQTLSAAGIYIDTLPNAGGCDSIVTLTLSILAASSASISETICSNSNVIFNGQALATAGTYTAHLANAAGCDSTVTLTLSVVPVSYSTLSHSMCSGSSYYFNGQLLSAGGTYIDTVPNAGGCDSIVTLTLTIIPTSAATVVQTICSGMSYVFNGQALTASGSYTDTFSNALGCDSFATLSLDVLPLPVAAFSIEPGGGTIPLGDISVTDQSTGADHTLWLLNNKVISLLAGGQLPVSDTGGYCIRLIAQSSAGCTDTSTECITVYNNHFYMPNAFTPNGDGTNDYISLYGSRTGVQFMDIKIYDRWGEKVFESGDLDFQWDGRYRGRLEEPGVYVYELEIGYVNGSTIHDKGSITLIR
jgi:gliding motility-associated-like protein